MFIESHGGLTLAAKTHIVWLPSAVDLPGFLEIARWLWCQQDWLTPVARTARDTAPLGNNQKPASSGGFLP